MTSWTKNELDKIGTADELDLVSMRRDGTLRAPVTMWVVRVDNDLYVRAFKGRNGPWFRGVLARHAGRIRSSGIEKNVTFVEETDRGVLTQVSDAYRSKYKRYEAQYVDPMLTAEAEAATIKLEPRTN